MPDDPLNTTPAPVIPPTPVGKRFRCVGCGCTMTANGEDIWSLGEGYKEWKDSASKYAKAIEKLNEELTAARADLANTKAELDALKGSSGGGTSRRIGSRIQ